MLTFLVKLFTKMATNNQDDEDDPYYKPFDPFESTARPSPTPSSTPAPTPDSERKQAILRTLKAIKDKFSQ